MEPTHEIRLVRDLLDFTEADYFPPPIALHSMGVGWIFRGHASAAFRLVPDLFRNSEAGIEWRTKEGLLLNVFARLSVQHLDRVPDNEIDWMVLARHHGVPSRLLDWTSHPLVAL